MTTATLEGVYRVPEVARYLYVTTANLENFVRPTPRDVILWMRRGLAAQHLAHDASQKTLIDFEDLISMRVISFLRGIGIPLQTIKQTKVYLERLTGHTHPFATEQLWTQMTDIFVEYKQFLVTASRAGQLPFLELVRDNLVNIHNLTFSGGIAESWSPSPGVLLRPFIQFGAPCIANTGIPTHALWRMFMGGDPTEFIARSYSIDESRIKLAIEWEERLARVSFTRAS